MMWKVLAISLLILCTGGLPPGLGNLERLTVCAMAPDLPRCAPPGQASASGGSFRGFGSQAMAADTAPGSPPPGSEQAGAITLVWDPSANRSVVGYRIHYGIEPGKYTNSLRVKGRLTTKAVVKNLEKGKTYYFAITAYDAQDHESALSAEVTNRPGGRPRAPAAANRPRSNGSNIPAGGPSVPASVSEAGKIPPRSYPRTSEGKIAPSR